MTISYQECIYAIICKNDTEQLSLIKYPVRLNYTPTDYQLRSGHNYSPNLSDQYSDCLRPLRYNEAIRDEGIRKKAIAFNDSIREVKDTYDVVAHSHRYGGWLTIPWKYNEDIKVEVATNFGYGSCSYMLVRFYYKDLQLTPYSNYIKYRYAGFSEIIRYTFGYKVEYQSWEKLMIDTINFYNAITLNKEHEIFEWLKNHLDNLLSGLCELSNASTCYAIASTIYTEKRESVVGDDLVCLKIEKIVGAIEFLDNFRSLPLQLTPDEYIERLCSIIIGFKPQLILYEKRYKQELEDKTKEVAAISSINDVKVYDSLVESYGSYFEWVSFTSKMQLFRNYITTLRSIKNDISTVEIKQRYNGIKDCLNKRTEAKSRIYSVNWLIDSVAKALDTVSNISQYESS